VPSLVIDASVAMAWALRETETWVRAKRLLLIVVEQQATVPLHGICKSSTVC
jgi:hypothetical protein